MTEKQHKTQPKVSIIVPIYNNKKYLHKCIQSILDQSLREIEVLLIDDGSTDKKVSAILNHFAKQDSRILLLTKTNAGYGATMNLGLSIARGKYIGIVESDDFIVKDMYQKLYDTAQQHQVDIVKCDFKVLTERLGFEVLKDVKIVREKNLYHQVIYPQKEDSLVYVEKYIWNALYSKEFLQQNSIKFNESPGASFQDNGFWFQTSMFASSIYIIDDALYVLRRNNKESSVKSLDKVFCACDEFAFIENILSKNSAQKEHFFPLFFYGKWKSYIFTLKRIAKHHRKNFFDVFYKEFANYYHAYDINTYCFEENIKNEFLFFIHNPQEFCEKINKPLETRDVRKRILFFYQNWKGKFYKTKPLLQERKNHK